MESRAKPPEFTLDLSADRSNVKDVVKGILHTIFFHRLFTPLAPGTQETLSLTLPCIPATTIPDLPALLETKTTTLLRQLDSSHPNPSSTTNPTLTLTLSFLEKKRRKSGWFVSAKNEEETVWETWTLRVEILSARSEVEAGRNTRVMERQLARAVWRVIEVVNKEKRHIPPIVSTEGNPFPYQISVGGGKA